MGRKSFSGLADAYNSNPATAFISSTPEGESRPKVDVPELKEENIRPNEIPFGYTIKKEGKTRRLQLLVRPSMIAAARDRANRAGVSLNEWINQLIEREIKE